MSQKRLAELLLDARCAAEELVDEKMNTLVEQSLAEARQDPLAPYKKTKWFPRFVVWELSLACNMRCAHCGSVAGARREDELSRDEMLAVCDELGELACERLTLLGGEPLIHPHWEDVTKRLQTHGVRVNVITNGWTLNEESLCDRLQAAGLTIVGISLDGMKESHDKLRREGSFDRIARGMELLKERGMPVAVCTVITSDSIRDLEEIYDFILARGVTVWQLQIASPLGRLKPDDPILIRPQQIERIYDFFDSKRKLKAGMHIDLADDIGYYPVRPGGQLRNNRSNGAIWAGCNAGIQVLGIDSNGDIKGCQSLPSQPPYIEGNVRKQSLKSIWQNPDGFAYNRKFTVAQLHGYCAQCQYGPLCKAGCSSQAIAFTGDIGNNPMCLQKVYNEKV